MLRKDKMPQLSSRQSECLFNISLAIFSLFAFLFLGERGYVLFDDSSSYMNLYANMEGVMPGYPLFLHGNKMLFGEERYLYAVVAEQAILATVCVMAFIAVIKKKFRLKYWESYVCYGLALLPFTTNMPESMTTHEIVTEGVAYALFYLFMAAFLQTVWNKSFKWLGILCGMTLFLSLIRSQLQILFGACGVACIYIAVLRPKTTNRKKDRRILSFFGGMVCCMVIGLAGIWATGKVSAAFQNVKMEVRREEQKKAQQAKNDAPFETEKSQEKEQPVRPIFTTSQYVTLIFSRGMYEADYEDYLLFEDEQVRKLYLDLFSRVDTAKCRYVYAEPGLWMWRDIVGGIGSVGGQCFHLQHSFYIENFPELVYSSDYSSVRNANQIKIGLTLIKAHFGRFLYHTLMLLPQAFICTVFFQIERIYLLCHLVTLFLYLSAVALMIWAYKDKKVENAYGEFMCSILGTNLILILVISLVFFGQQRYLVYNFGIFYISGFLLFMKLWRLYLHDLAVRGWDRIRHRDSL
ncbi:MAG: hypothetical protein HDR04_00985 [Lachnospiraceae bacterium]|nr:hypothetical protein [Lachnospiraceae bacterium]